jgi:hypothetical protein
VIKSNQSNGSSHSFHSKNILKIWNIKIQYSIWRYFHHWGIKDIWKIFDFWRDWDIMLSVFERRILIRRMLVITPKKKSPAKALFLLSVLADQFPPVPTCHPPKGNDRLYSEECEPSHKEFSHRMRGLMITPSSIVGLGAEAVYGNDVGNQFVWILHEKDSQFLLFEI